MANYIDYTLELISEASDVPFAARKLYADTYMKHGKTVSKSKEAVDKAYKAVEIKFGTDTVKKLKAYHKANMNEGMTKKGLEAKVEKACNCDGGASLDANDHDKNCPARKVLKEMGL